MEATRVNAAALEAFCVAAMTAAGIGREDAELSARVFVTTDTWGTFTHGTRPDPRPDEERPPRAAGGGGTGKDRG